MKNKLLIVLMTSFLIGCSSDSSTDDSQSTPSSTNKLKKIEEIQNGVVIKTTSFQYNSLGNVTKMTVKDYWKSYETTCNYDSSDIMISWNLKEYYISDPSDVINQVNTLEYTNGLITNICINRTEKYSDIETKSVDRISESYSSSGLTSTKHYIQITGGEDTVCEDITTVDNEEFFEYFNGNLIYYSAPGTGFSDEYNRIEYDQGKHYLSSVKPDAFRKIVGANASVNNMKKVNVYNSYDDELTGTVKFENTYDKNNNIIKAVEKYYYAGSSTPSNTTTINYYYY